MYSSLITDIDALQARARPLVDRYLEHIREDKAMEVIMVSHGVSWCLMVSHAVSLCLMVSLNVSWCLMVSHAVSWCLMVSHGV